MKTEDLTIEDVNAACLAEGWGMVGKGAWPRDATLRIGTCNKNLCMPGTWCMLASTTT